MAAEDAAEGNADATGVPPDLGSLVDEVEAHLLGGSRRYTRSEVCEAAGVSADEARELWRALGFATVGDDERMFTDADADALRNVKRLEQVGEIDEEFMRAMTRILGQSFARLASWQGQLVVEIVGRRPELLAEGSTEQITQLIDELTPVVGELHDYVWRRQLAAYISRVTSNIGAGQAPDGQPPRPSNGDSPSVIGFVDMADFTGFTRRSSESQLREVLDEFEELATTCVSEHRGQIVKTIGDEILYIADDPADGAQIAVQLVAEAAQRTALPPLRAGVAYGPVLRRLGDVFGQTVNIASRLVGIARPDSILVDERLAEELSEDGRFALSAMRPVSVRGYRHLHPARLRAAAETTAGTDSPRR